MDKDSVKGKAEKVTGRVKQATGNITGNQRLQAEGVRDRLKGEAHDTWGTVKQAARDVSREAREGRRAERASHP